MNTFIKVYVNYISHEPFQSLLMKRFRLILLKQARPCQGGFHYKTEQSLIDHVNHLKSAESEILHSSVIISFAIVLVSKIKYFDVFFP